MATLSKFKKDLTTSTEATLTELDSKLCGIETRVAEVKSMDDGEARLAEFEVMQITDAFKNAINQVRDSLKQVRESKVQNWVERKAELERAVEATSGPQEGADAIVEVLDELLSDEKERVKKEKANTRYKLTKDARKFQTNGVTGRLSRIGSELCYYAGLQVDKRGESVLPVVSEVGHASHVAACAFKGEGSPAENVFKLLDWTASGTEGTLVKKLGHQESKALRGMWSLMSLANAKDVQKACTEASSEAFPFAEEQFFFSVACRNFTMRSGGTSFPMAGVPCWIWARDKQICVAIFELLPLMQQGDLRHLDQFTTSVEKRACRELDVQLLVLEKGDSAFVPAGHVPVVTGMEPINTCVVAPQVNKYSDFEAMVDKEVAELVRVSLMGAARNNSEKVPWSTLLPKLSKLGW